MAFKQAGSLDPHGAPLLRSEILANSVTFTELDSVKAASGFIAANTTGALTFGHITAIVTSRDLGVLTTGVAGAAIDSFVGAYATASDNQTVGKYRGKCDVSKTTVYSVAPDAAIGTTTGSNLLGYFVDVASATATSESSALTTTNQYGIFGVDPNVSANQLVHIYESQVFGV